MAPFYRGPQVSTFQPNNVQVKKLWDVFGGWTCATPDTAFYCTLPRPNAGLKGK